MRSNGVRPRVICVDIDGTVTDYERRLDWKGVEALRRAEANGIPVMPATGNVPPVTKAFSNFLGLSGPMICENGGVVYSSDLKRRKLLATRARADRAVAYLRKKGFDAKGVWSDPWRESEVALQLNLDEEEVKRALKGKGFDVVATRFAIHITEPGLHKFNGLKAALPYVRLRPRPRLEEVLAIGDSNNDEELLRGCGFSGAVANATERAKAAAQYVARRKHGAGVAEILEHYSVI